MNEHTTTRTKRETFKEGRRYKLIFAYADTTYVYQDGHLYDEETGQGINPEGITFGSFKELRED